MSINWRFGTYFFSSSFLILILLPNSFDDCFEQNDSFYMQEKMLYHKVWWSSQNEALSLGLKLMKHFFKFCMPQAGSCSFMNHPKNDDNVKARSIWLDIWFLAREVVLEDNSQAPISSSSRINSVFLTPVRLFS